MSSRLAVLFVSVGLATPAAAQHARPFPLRVVELSLPAEQVTYAPDVTAVQDLLGRDRLRFANVALPDGSMVDLDVERIDLGRRRFGFHVDGAPAGDLLEGLDLSLWRGGVVGVDDSQVMLSFSNSLSGGWIRRADDLVHLIPRPGAGGDWRGGHVLAVSEQTLADLGAEIDFECAAGPVPGVDQSPPRGAPGPLADGDAVPRECTIAIETDFQLYEVFGDLDAMTAYVTTLLGFVSDRYELQALTTLTFPYLQFYTTPDDPWTSQDNGGNCIDVLYELQSAWAGDVPQGATLGHLISGADLGCGVAWLDVLCVDSYNFSVSGNVNGLVSFPVVQQSYNWDFMVIAHELGHNFASPHTHDFCPPLDECPPSQYWGSCQDETVCSSSGTIMSYCHLCPGGTANITTFFHPVVADVLTAGAAACLPELELLRAKPPGLLLPDLEPLVHLEVLGEPTGPVDVLYRFGNGAFLSIEMESTGGGAYEARLPAPSCSSDPQFYFRYDDAAFGALTLPANAPAETFRSEVGIPSPVFHDPFQSDRGWTVENLGASAGEWERGVPVNDANWPYAPHADHGAPFSPGGFAHGGGQCYLTENEWGESDVDGGAVRLVSPIFDFTAGVPYVSYSYYFWVDVDGAEELVVETSHTGTAGPWIEIARYDTAVAGWRTDSFGQAELLSLGVKMTDEVQFRFTVADHDFPNIVEAAVDAFQLSLLYCDPIGTNYCGPANLNSTGDSAVIRAVGSEVVADGDVVLVASGLPYDQFGYFLVSNETGFVPFPPGSQGNLCLSGSIGRYRKQVASTLESGWLVLPIKLKRIPTPGGTVAVQPGETWYFQGWFRDANPHSTSNMTDGVGITFQ